MSARKVEAALRTLGDPKKAVFLQRFFKTGPGEYAAGDRFLGVTVPQIRGLARVHRDLGLAEIERLLHSPYNEVRLLALILLCHRYAKGDVAEKERVYRLYTTNLPYVNNWNLVDTSAPYIVGSHLLGRPRAPLYRWVRSENLWVRRVAVVATQQFIRSGDYTDTLELSRLCLHDEEDLMHKACGWMLREVGKKDVRVLEKFLDRHVPEMPRTMLRYAIEKFSPARRKEYLNR